MAAFRRCILALAVLALFAGLASAQSSGGVSMNCGFQDTSKSIRSESLTEQVGDIVISCTGGQNYSDGTAIQSANITVSMPVAITSRFLSTTGGINVSEALLLTDDPSATPGFTYGGYGSGANISVCGNAGTLTGCPAYALHMGSPVAPVMSNIAA